MLINSNSRAFTLAIAFLFLASCRHQQPQDVWRDSDPTYVPFRVQDIAVSPGNRYVGLAIDERPPSDKQLSSDTVDYVLDLKTGAHRRLGTNGTFLASLNDQVIYFHYGTSSEPLTVATGLDIAMKSIGEHNGGWWNPKTKTMIVEMGWPKDREGFNSLELLNVATGSIVSFPVRQESELVGICPATGNIYTEHLLANDKPGADEYDANGKFLRTMQSPLAVYSSGCGYALPFAAIGNHGPDDWGVFQTSTGKKTMDFPWIEDGKSDLHWFRAWNPRHDNLLLMYSTIYPPPAAGKMDTIDLLDVDHRRVVQSWPHPENSSPIEWSGDGDATVTVRDHHVVIEPIALK